MSLFCRYLGYADVTVFLPPHDYLASCIQDQTFRVIIPVPQVSPKVKVMPSNATILSRLPHVAVKKNWWTPLPSVK